MFELTEGHYYYIAAMFLAAFRPIFFKQYKDYFAMTVYLSLLAMFSGGVGYMYYNLKDDENIKDKVLESLSRENIINSLISELRFILKQFAVINLPLSVSIPMNNLWMVSSAYFAKKINNEIPSRNQIISIIILIFGTIILNLNKVFGEKKKPKVFRNYYKGIISLLLSTILGGYIYSVFKKISTETQNPGFTMSVESGGSLIVATILLILERLFVRKIKVPPFKEMIKMFIGLVLVFNVDIILMFTGLSKIKQLDTIYLSQIATIIPVFIGLTYYKEKLDIYKIIGLLTIIFGVIFGAN